MRFPYPPSISYSPNPFIPSPLLFYHPSDLGLSPSGFLFKDIAFAKIRLLLAYMMQKCYGNVSERWI